MNNFRAKATLLDSDRRPASNMTPCCLWHTHLSSTQVVDAICVAPSQKKQKRRARYLLNRERVLAQVKAYRESHLPQVNARAEKYRERKRALDAERERRSDAAARNRHKWKRYPRDPTLKRVRSQRYRFAKFGITRGEFEAMCHRQMDLCAICGLPLQTVAWRGGKQIDGRHIDHCHKTGKVRGVVHRECNLLIAHARESVTVLRRAIDYLVRHGDLELAVE